eukprot:UN32433
MHSYDAIMNPKRALLRKYWSEWNRYVHRWKNEGGIQWKRLESIGYEHYLRQRSHQCLLYWRKSIQDRNHRTTVRDTLREFKLRRYVRSWRSLIEMKKVRMQQNQTAMRYLKQRLRKMCLCGWQNSMKRIRLLEQASELQSQKRIMRSVFNHWKIGRDHSIKTREQTLRRFIRKWKKIAIHSRVKTHQNGCAAFCLNMWIELSLGISIDSIYSLKFNNGYDLMDYVRNRYQTKIKPSKYKDFQAMARANQTHQLKTIFQQWNNGQKRIKAIRKNTFLLWQCNLEQNKVIYE